MDLKSLPWRGMLILLGVAVVLGGLYQKGYLRGHEDATQAGNAALSELQARVDREKREQAERENAVLRAWQERYQAQVLAAHQAETGYQATLASLQQQKQQLLRKIDDVTQRWIDEQGQPHAVQCVFTRGFVQQYNAAFGIAESGDQNGAAAAATQPGQAPGPVHPADARLRDSGVTQRDILANITDNGPQCQALSAQVNGLLDYIEGLQR
ncbi:lipoprotein [Serratia sp. Ag2]|nr:lipoprotein [Serratia sp. Ag2]